MINGIAVGPTAFPRGGPCVGADAQQAPIARAVGTEVAIAPSFLPAGTTETMSLTTVCQGVVALAERTYFVEPDPDTGRLGGGFTIVRWRGQPFAPVAVPDERWSAATISGRSAAIATPILANGLGQSAVVTFAQGIVTTVQATGLPVDEVRRIAEGVN